MFSSATNRVIRKWCPRWFAGVGKCPSPAALYMHLLDAFIKSTDVGNSNFAGKQTERQVTFACAFVAWMLHERHVDCRMRRDEFFAWKSHGNCTAIDCWPAFEPKPSSEQAVIVGEHSPCVCSDVSSEKKPPTVRKCHSCRAGFVVGLFALKTP